MQLNNKETRYQQKASQSRQEMDQKFAKKWHVKVVEK